MPHPWPADTVFSRLELEPQNRDCPDCSRRLRLCDHRHRRLFTFDGPLHLVCKLAHCPDPLCPQHYRTVSPEDEAGIALPRWIIGWDVFAWIGHRRFARHWSITQIRNELADTYAITLSADTLEDTLRRYQTMVAARHSDPSRLAKEYADVEDLVLSIDGLQPEKGHETLYVVRELRRQRVWFAESLLSSSADEVRRLLEQAKDWAERLGKPVAGWVSDKQDAFVTGIAAVFPGVPHRYCHNHFLRDLAKPTLELDSHAKVQMRSKVRGLRELEKQVLSERAAAANPVAAPAPAAVEAERAPAQVAGANAAGGAVVPAAGEAAGANDRGGEVVLDYCAMVRGILNDDQGGPLRPPGLRMAEALTEVRASLQRNLEAKKGGPQRNA
jgi:GNAT superfamily N-acetyltransferase